LPCLGFRVRPVLPHKSERLVSMLLCVLNFLALSLPLFLSPVPNPCTCPVPLPSLLYISPSVVLPPTLSWYPPISSLSVFYTTFSDPLSNPPPTLSWYPPLILFRLSSSHCDPSPRESPTTCPSTVLVKPESGSLHHVTLSDDVPLDTRLSSEDVALNGTLTTVTCQDGCVIGTSLPRSSPHPCNVAGVSRGRIPITVHLMRLANSAF
jgi:hypothetical protein